MGLMNFKTCPYEKESTPCPIPTCSADCRIYKSHLESSNKQLTLYNKTYEFKEYQHDCPLCKYWLEPYTDKTHRKLVQCTNEICLTLWELTYTATKYVYTRAQKSVEYKCPKCTQPLKQENQLLSLYTCNNCNKQWWRIKSKDPEIGYYYQERKNEVCDMKSKKLYKRFKREFHLDFIPDTFCTSIYCLDEDELCEKTGCPIMKMRHSIAKLEIEGFDDAELKKNKENTTEWLTEIKKKWDHMSLGGRDLSDIHMRYKIVYFNYAPDKMSVIWEPFPHNRFGSEFEAIEFLNGFIKSNPKENEDDYYVSAVYIVQRETINKKKVKPLGNMREDLNEEEFEEYKTFERDYIESSVDKTVAQITMGSRIVNQDPDDLLEEA